MTIQIHPVIVFTAVFILTSCAKQTEVQVDFQERKAPVLKSNFVEVNKSIGGFYSALPSNYDKSKKKYPLLVFLHGGGQMGNGRDELDRVLHDGIPELLLEQRFPPNFTVNNEHFSFIILVPQFKFYPENLDVLSFVEYSLENYNVDTTRIYLSGLSSGGIVTVDVAAEYPTRFAAIVPMSGVSIYPDLNKKAEKIASASLPIWAFHNEKDGLIDIEAVKYFIGLINSFLPKNPSKLTIFKPFGLFNHDSWTKAADPTYKEDGKNIYEWMLQHRR